MIFKRPTLSYGKSPLPETPYQKAGQVWDERIGSARVQARNWRLMALGCLGLAMATSAALVWRSLQSTVTPYVIEVDMATGSPRAIGPALEAYTPTDAQIAHHLAAFIDRIRSLSSDAVIVRKKWLGAYAYVTTQGSNTLDEYAQMNEPFVDVGRLTRTVDVISVVRVSDDTFQARWIETQFSHGTREGATHHTGLFTLIVKPPRDADTLRVNPLGLYIHEMNWAEDLVTGDKE